MKSDGSACLGSAWLRERLNSPQVFQDSDELVRFDEFERLGFKGVATTWFAVESMAAATVES